MATRSGRRHTRSDADPDIPRDEAASALGARRELGEDMEPAVVDAFVAHVERSIDARVDQRLAAAAPTQRPARSGGDGPIALAVTSLIAAIPVTAIAVEESTLVAIVAWLGIVGVNVAHALGRR